MFDRKNSTLWHTLMLILFVALLLVSCGRQGKRSNAQKSLPNWALGPFTKDNSLNPIMGSVDSVSFMDPILKKPVYWEAKDAFNPAAVVRNDTLYLLYRAEDTIGKYKGTSRVGLAWSTDGLHFTRYINPVLYPANDDMKIYEWEGGTEDPRIVQDDNGTYYLTYTAYDGKTARLCEATSRDLRHWTKQGPVFAKADNGKYLNLWSKSGAIVTKRDGDHIIATKINGKYWMYWGDTDIYLATSNNLVDWTPVQDSNGNLLPALRPRKGKFDSKLVESGPPAMITKNGILLIYNSSNAADSGDTSLPAGTYSAGQALFDSNNPEQLKDRLSHNFFKPERMFEKRGQVDNVTFLEGLVPYKGTWYLYYGAADSTICVATYHPEG